MTKSSEYKSDNSLQIDNYYRGNVYNLNRNFGPIAIKIYE